jgi:uncharacterized protein DUF1570
MRPYNAPVRSRASIPLIAVLAVLSPPSLSQTDDHEAEDRRYQERLKTAPPATPESIIATADRLVRGSKDYASKSTAHWQVRTDDSSVDVAASAALLESFRTWFESFWKGRLATTPSEELGRVYVFGTFHDYNKLLTGGARHGAFRPAGHYNLLTDVVALYLGSIPRGELTDTLVHEGAHMLVAREVLRGRTTAPWLAEGLATYFESTVRDGKGGFETGAVGGRGAKTRLDNLKRLAGAKTPWSIDDVLRSDSSVFYADDAPANYAGSWLLVHALFHADGGKHAEEFARYIAGAAESGDADADALYAATGLDAAGLTALVVAHARTIIAR